MASEIMKITLTQTNESQDEVTNNLPSSTNPETVSENMPDIKGVSLGSLTKTVKASAVASAALKLAKEAYNRLNTIYMNDRVIDEKLRNYGGAGYTPNSFDERFNIFGKREAGNSVVYRK